MTYILALALAACVSTNDKEETIDSPILIDSEVIVERPVFEVDTAPLVTEQEENSEDCVIADPTGVLTTGTIYGYGLKIDACISPSNWRMLSVFYGYDYAGTPVCGEAVESYSTGIQMEPCESCDFVHELVHTNVYTDMLPRCPMLNIGDNWWAVAGYERNLELLWLRETHTSYWIYAVATEDTATYRSSEIHITYEEL